MDNPLILSVAGPAVTALLGLVVVWLQEWRRGRDAFTQRSHARQEATELAAFYEKWIQTQKLVCSPEDYERARRVAQDRLDRLAAVLPEPEELERESDSTLSLRRLLLLTHSPESRAAQVVRWIYYALFVLTLLYMGGSLIPEDDGTFVHWTEIVFLNTLMIVLTVIARTVAVAFDDRDRRRRLARLKAGAPAIDGASAPVAAPVPSAS